MSERFKAKIGVLAMLLMMLANMIVKTFRAVPSQNEPQVVLVRAEKLMAKSFFLGIGI